MGAFPLGDGLAPRIYRLSEDATAASRCLALVGAPGKSQPAPQPHHVAVISGVYGDEHDVLYRRSGDRLERVGRITVRRGNAVALMPTTFTRSAWTGDVDSLHLHAYRRSLEQLPKRITFESESGGRYRVFGPPKVYEPVTE